MRRFRRRARELAIAIPVLIVDGGEREAEGESACQADLQQARAGALGGENRDGEGDGEQVARGAGEENDQRTGEEDEHPLRQKVAPAPGAPDQDAGTDRDGTPEERVPIVERGADGEWQRVERRNPEGREYQPCQMAGERDGAFDFLRQHLESVGGQVIRQNASGERAGGEALENLPGDDCGDGSERGDLRSAPFSSVKKQDRDQQDGLIRGERRQTPSRWKRRATAERTCDRRRKCRARWRAARARRTASPIRAMFH